MHVTRVNKSCLNFIIGVVLFIILLILHRKSHVHKGRISPLSPQQRGSSWLEWWRNGGSSSDLSLCSTNPTNLVGEVHIDAEDNRHLTDATTVIGGVAAGGHWEPSNCRPRHKVALIIPFQDPFLDRTKNLKILVKQLHTILQRQLLSYTIYVSKQHGSTGWFNKGLVMNIAFTEASAETSYDCFIFHDVDLIPVDDRNMYMCDSQPKHMCAHINNKTVTYKQATGGVLAMTAAQFKKLNGFSNKYWGWGNEDDNMYDRMLIHGVKLLRSSPNVGRYIHLKHKRTYKGTGYRPQSRDVNLVDGLNSLSSSRYKIVETKFLPMFTWIHVNVTQP